MAATMCSSSTAKSPRLRISPVRMRPASVLKPFTLALAALTLASCAADPSGDTVLDAIGKGAVAGIVEGLTGQEQPNPYATGDTQTEPTQNASVAPDPKYLAAHYGKRHADLIVQGHIDIGMSEDEVRLAWGDPAARTPKGKLQEIWNYGDDKVVFTKGKVSAVTH